MKIACAAPKSTYSTEHSIIKFAGKNAPHLTLHSDLKLIGNQLFEAGNIIKILTKSIDELGF